MTTKNPPTYTHGLGELIRAHRLYIGLSQRAMSARLDMDRRDYQRIENGRDACPPGLLNVIEALSDQFCHEVDLIVEEAERRAPGPLALAVDSEYEWGRLVAGRAAIETTEDAPITLTMSGKSLPRSA